MRKNMRIKWNNSAWFLVAIMVIVLDQVSKMAALNYLSQGTTKVVLPFLNLHLTFNKGAAYSFLHTATGWQNMFFIILATLVSIWLVYALLTDKRFHANVLYSGYALILGGAIGNIVDRLRYHAVIDFISPHLGDWYFAIFNVADSAITIGAICLVGFWLTE